MNSITKLSARLILSFGNFITVLSLNSKSHLLDGKKYKFFISVKEILDLSITSLILKNSTTSGFPKIKGN